jgi:DNA ligase (NAD+)
MKKVKIITECPSCSYQLTRVKDQLFCKNNECLATQGKKVLHFLKAMKIKGLGEKTVEKLCIESIHDIYNMEEVFIKNTIGDKLGDKLVIEIQQSKQTNLEKVLTAFSIPLIGSTAAKKLNKVVSEIDNITFEICKEVGLGDKAAQSLIDWIVSIYPKYKDLPLDLEANSTSESQTNKINTKVCITGKLEDYRSRELASSYLESKGITIVSGVSKTLDYLVCEDNKPSSKLSKANSYGIPIISIKNLIEEIEK